MTASAGMCGTAWLLLHYPFGYGCYAVGKMYVVYTRWQVPRCDGDDSLEGAPLHKPPHCIDKRELHRLAAAALQRELLCKRVGPTFLLSALRIRDYAIAKQSGNPVPANTIVGGELPPDEDAPIGLQGDGSNPIICPSAGVKGHVKGAVGV